MQPVRKAPFLICVAITASAHAASPPAHRPELDRVGHIIVLFLESRSFDHLYGLLPGAEGIQDSGFSSTQLSAEGRQFATLPAVINNLSTSNRIDSRFATDMPNGPFRADRYVGLEERTSDPLHRFYQEQEQIDGGKMDRFVASSDTGALPMGYIDGSPLPLFRLAREYTLADRFFHAAFGGAFLNHFWLICACTPRYENAPENLVAQLDADGRMIKDGVVTPDGYAVNTIEPVSAPHDPRIADDRQRLPLQTMTTIGRRLTDAGVPWAWYSGGYADAAGGHPDPTFIYYHEPFGYFADYGEGTPGRAEHLKDERDMIRAIRDRTLPRSVSTSRSAPMTSIRATPTLFAETIMRRRSSMRSSKASSGTMPLSSSPTPRTVASGTMWRRRRSIGGDRARGCPRSSYRRLPGGISSIIRYTTRPRFSNSSRRVGT